jgi:starch synthase (maltosyl-transferring)
MILYNLFPLLAGPAGHWEAHFRRAADMGFDWIFINPVQRSGRSGSLYSIADYFQIDPRMIDAANAAPPEQQVRAATALAERLGLGVMVDLVVNHCAADSALTQAHPDWFLHEPDGSIAHPFCVDNGEKVVWRDLARLDYEHTRDPEGLYRHVLAVVEYLLGLGFRGFRCDAAYQLPGHVWHRLIAEVKQKHPNAVFAAETLGCTADQTKQTAQAGFDYVFNSSKWWDLQSPWLLAQYQLIREAAPSISFAESHDTRRLFEEVGGNVDAMKQRYFFASFFSAGSMMPIGFEYGFRRPLHVVDTRPGDWEAPNVDLRNFITKVNAVKRRHAIFQEECPTSVIPQQNPNVLLLWKASARTREEALLILNRDTGGHQYFHAENLLALVQARAPLRDVSPEYGLDYIPVRPFSYDLRPGQGIVLVTEREPR